MTAILYSTDPSSIAAFIIFTLIMGFLGGWATGRAFAGTWRAPLMLIPAVLLLGAAVRFLHYAIAGEDLTSIYYYVESSIIVALGALYGFRSCRSDQMARQYPGSMPRLVPWGGRPKAPLDEGGEMEPLRFTLI